MDWFTFLTYRLLDRFNASPLDVFSYPRGFPASRLPPFYSSVLKTWTVVGSSSSPSGLVLELASDGPLLVSSVSCIILQAEKFIKCDWLRPVGFKPNLKYLHVKITASFHGN